MPEPRAVALVGDLLATQAKAQGVAGMLIDASVRDTEELVELGGVTAVEPQRFAELCQRYALEMDPGSIPGLVERFDLQMPGEPIQ